MDADRKLALDMLKGGIAKLRGRIEQARKDEQAERLAALREPAGPSKLVGNADAVYRLAEQQAAERKLADADPIILARLREVEGRAADLANRVLVLEDHVAELAARLDKVREWAVKLTSKKPAGQRPAQPRSK